MAKDHPLCPTSDPKRWRFLDVRRKLDDETAIQLGVEAYKELGFQGLIGFHFYNEPLIAKERMLRVIHRIKEQVPQAAFVLWSNGNLIQAPAEELDIFNKIFITNYKNRDFSFLHKISPQFIEVPENFDERREITPAFSLKRCYRIFNELTIDAYGNVHVCCIDWEGHVSPGNVFTAPFKQLAGRFQQLQERVGIEPMAQNSPAICLTCTLRHDHLHEFSEKAVPQIRLFLNRRANQGTVKEMAPKRTGVILTDYQISETDLKEHFRRNETLYKSKSAQVYLMTHKNHENLPAFIRQLINPASAAAKALNQGIAAALRDSCEVIIQTEVSVVFSEQSWNDLSDVFPDRAVLSLSSRKRPSAIAMTAGNWTRIEYSENGDEKQPGIMDLLPSVRNKNLRIFQGYSTDNFQSAVQKNGMMRPIENPQVFIEEEIKIPAAGRRSDWALFRYAALKREIRKKINRVKQMILKDTSRKS